MSKLGDAQLRLVEGARVLGLHPMSLDEAPAGASLGGVCNHRTTQLRVTTRHVISTPRSRLNL